MRVSTQQFFYQNSKNITDKLSDVNTQSNNLASGKRVESAKDDPINFSTLTGYKNELVKLEQYQRNITQAKNRNSSLETSLSLAENTLLQVKQLMVQGNNGALSATDRLSLADQMQQHLNQLLDIANAKDETGGYIFAGYQVDKEPFSVLPDNSVSYNGDSGVKHLAIANNVSVALNMSGEQAFMKVPNHVGDFTPSYTTNNGEVSVQSAKVVNRGVYNTSTNPPPYTLNFTDTNGDGQLEVSALNGSGSAITTINPYTPGQTISFNGVEVKIDGTPAVGDSIKLASDETVSVFETLKAAIDWLKVGSTTANTAQHQVDYGHILSQVNAAQSYVSTQQAQAGINLNLIDRQESNHADSKLFLDKGRSSLEDLDYASAVSQFEQSKVALQAAQQTFSQIQQLSLFNFL